MDDRRFPFREANSQDVTCSIEQWIYISTSGYYIFDVEVRDLCVHNQQWIQANIFV